MVSQAQLSLIQSYLEKSQDKVEKELLNEILEELQYRYPAERSDFGTTCSRCNSYVDISNTYCPECGQLLD